MIFKSIFVPAHKSEDPDKRLASIDKLQASNEKHKAILHELSFNDSNEKVSLAALAKLDDFVLWVKSAEHALSPVVKREAQKQVFVFLEDSLRVSDKEFQYFVKESKNKILLEQLLFSSERLRKFPDLALTIVHNLDNKQTLKRFFELSDNEEQQISVLSKVDDYKMLNRLSKKAISDKVLAVITSKQKTLDQQKEMPSKVKQEITLINSRLLALLDSENFEYMQNEFTKLLSSFEQLKKDFHYLDEVSAASYSEKFLSLKAKYTLKIKSLEEAHNEQLASQKLSDDISDLQARCDEVENQIKLLFSEDNAQVDAQVKILSNALASCEEDIDTLHSKDLTISQQSLLKAVNMRITSFKSSLAKVPELAQNAEDINKITAKLLTIQASLNESDRFEYEEIKQFSGQVTSASKEFAERKKSMGQALSSHTVEAYNLAYSNVKKRLAEIQNNAREQTKKLEGKLRVANRLIREGKFTAAISTFHYVQGLVNELGNSLNPKTQTAFDNTKLEIEKLQDWQAYIAQPRKPALLEETQALAATPIDDHFERAETVKQLRQQWLSFGMLHTPEDKALNDAFNEAIEKAFAPCRVFFSQLEKLRKENLENAQAIIAQVKQVDEETPVNTLSGQIDKFKKQFSQVGEIERSQLKKVNRDFTQSLKPLQKRISAWQQNNAEQKQGLINEVLALLELDDSQEAANQAKQLQKKWKDIGFAGKTNENELWQAFRAANDKLFSAYHQTLNVHKNEQSAALNDVSLKMDETKALIEKATNQGELAKLGENIAALEADINALDTKFAKTAHAKLKEIKLLIKKQMSQAALSKQRENLVALFDVLKAYTNAEIPPLPDKFPGPYKSWLLQQQSFPAIIKDLNRDELVQVASILFDDAGVSYSFGDDERRKSLQISLMAHKLEGNEPVLPESVLGAYVSHGPMSSTDIASIDTMFAIYEARL